MRITRAFLLSVLMAGSAQAAAPDLVDYEVRVRLTEGPDRNVVVSYSVGANDGIETEPMSVESVRGYVKGVEATSDAEGRAVSKAVLGEVRSGSRLTVEPRIADGGMKVSYDLDVSEVEKMAERQVAPGLKVQVPQVSAVKLRDTVALRKVSPDRWTHDRELADARGKLYRLTIDVSRTR